jgi:hypothetical protein
MPINNWENKYSHIIMKFCTWIGVWWSNSLNYAWRCVLTSFYYYDITIESKFAADESIFSSTPDLSFIFSSTPDLSMLFTSEVLFFEYFEFYQHSTPEVSSNQILGILEVYNKSNYFYVIWDVNHYFTLFEMYVIILHYLLYYIIWDVFHYITLFEMYVII